MGMALLGRYWRTDSCGTLRLEGSSMDEAADAMGRQMDNAKLIPLIDQF
jgi:hypothetical protein